MTFTEFLLWLATGPGSLIVAGFIAAYVLERFSVWQKLNHDLKGFLVVLLSVGVSYAAKRANVELIASNELLNQLFSAFAFYVSTQVGYKKYFDVNLASQVKK